MPDLYKSTQIMDNTRVLHYPRTDHADNLQNVLFSELIQNPDNRYPASGILLAGQR